MKILLTGATGFVGKATLPLLLEAQHEVRVLVRQPDRLPPNLRGHRNLEIRRASLDTTENLRGTLEGVEAVAHLAGLISARKTSDYYRVNAGGTKLLAQEAVQTDPGVRWIQVSSLAATGPGQPSRDTDEPHPVSHYGKSKLAGERVLPEVGLQRWLALRPPAVYGPGDRAFLPFFQAAARSRVVPLPSGGPSHLSLIHVEDLGRAIAAALEMGEIPTGRAFHVCHPQPVAVPDMLEEIAAAVGGKAKLLSVPQGVVKALAYGLNPVRMLCGSPKYLSPDKVRELSAPAWCCDPQPMMNTFKWKPHFDLTHGVRHTVADYVQRGWLSLTKSQLEAGREQQVERTT